MTAEQLNELADERRMSPYWRSTQFEEDRRRNDRELREAHAQRVREQAERAKRDAGQQCDTGDKESDR